MCPFLQSACIEAKCKIWVESDKECMIVQTFYTVNLMKEDYLSEIRQKVREIRK
jgi:hypothetical protein